LDTRVVGYTNLKEIREKNRRGIREAERKLEEEAKAIALC
jgi:hypothetical protein